MKRLLLSLSVSAAFVFAPALAEANTGDFTNGVAIGSSYAGIDSAPSNGLIVQGSVGIGTASPSGKLDITTGASTDVLFGQNATYTGYNALSLNGNITDAGTLGFFGGSTGDTDLYIQAPGEIVFRTNGNTINGIIDTSGHFTVGAFAASTSTTVCQTSNVLAACSSARRFKDKIKPSQLGLKEVLAMKPITFDFKDHKENWEKHDFGFVAEDMAEINPLFVTYDKEGEINGVRYMQLTAVEAKAIQQLDATIKAQEAEITELKQAISRLSQAKKTNQ